MDWLESFLGQNTSQEYLVALVVFALTYVGLHLGKGLIVGWVRRISLKTENDFDDLVVTVLDSVNQLFYLGVALYVGVQWLDLPAFTRRVSNVVTWIVVGWFVVQAVLSLIDYGIRYIFVRRNHERDEAETEMILSLMSIAVRVVVWAIAGVMILQNLGVEVTALIGGLGIGGLAIAFAFQRILEDVFAYFAIYFDKPFKVGDYINVGQDGGTVEHIGVKTTRLRTLVGDEMVVSNKELTEARVNNFKKLERRRVVMNFGVVYETSVKKLKEIPGICEKLIEDVAQDLEVGEGKDVEFSRCHFTTLGDFSLNFELVYFMNVSDYVRYMDVQQSVNLGLMEEFAKRKIEFAYPTQVVEVRK